MYTVIKVKVNSEQVYNTMLGYKYSKEVFIFHT